jgi:hypothetical protein
MQELTVIYKIQFALLSLLAILKSILTFVMLIYIFMFKT